MSATTPKSIAPDSTLEINGSVGAAMGNVQHAGDVKIQGTIRNGMAVDAGGQLTVGEGIEAAKVHAGKSIAVNGNIIGHGKGHCSSGESITFRIANGATLQAQGDVVALLEIVNSRVMTAAALRCEKGQICGGHVTANQGIYCDALGSTAGIVTLVEPGIDEELRRIGALRPVEINGNFKKIFTVRSKIGPLLAKQRSLTAKQKEIATEMLYEASELEERTENLVRELRRVVAPILARAKPEVVVSSIIHAGVTIRFNGVETFISESIEGPVRISIKPYGHSHQIILTRLKSKNVISLKTSIKIDPNLTALLDAIAERKSQKSA